jgi:hypothetical protein
MDAMQSSAPKVEPLRAEFAVWLERYLPMPGHVRVLATAWFGVMQKCCHNVDALVSACCEVLLPVGGDAGAAVVQKITAGKPLDRLTLGQIVQVLEAIDTIISPKLREFLPNGVGHSRVLGKTGIRMLHELSRMRNDFAHRRWQKEDGDRLASDFLTTAYELCNSRLVAVTIALEECQTQQSDR